jgi:small neutral amino acid transporter SnatA (MarC family)
MKPRLRVEIVVAAGAILVLLLPACSTSWVSLSVTTSSRPAPSQGSSAAATPSATPATGPAAVTMAGALAQLHPLTGPFLAPGSNPGILPES